MITYRKRTKKPKVTQLNLFDLEPEDELFEEDELYDDTANMGGMIKPTPTSAIDLLNLLEIAVDRFSDSETKCPDLREIRDEDPRSLLRYQSGDCRF